MVAAAKTKPSVYRFARFHPALIADHVLSATGPKSELIRPVFWPQSPLDSACGACTAASALSILSLVRPAAMLAMSRRKSGASAIFFEQMRESWHTGIDVDELVERINAMRLPLKLTARFKSDADLEEFAIATLMKGELVALSIASLHTRRTSHLTLAIGAGGSKRGNKTEVDRLFLLDSSCAAPVFREWNAVLTLLPTSRTKRFGDKLPVTKKRKPLDWGYSAAEWHTETVRITGAIKFHALTERV